MDELAAFASLGVALGAGLLVGFERQQTAGVEKLPEKSLLGGARTFPLVALAGAVAALAGRWIGAWFVAVVFAAVAALVVVSYLDDVRRTHDHGLTSETALLLVFLLGALAATDGVFSSAKERALVVVSAAVVSTFVLSLKPPLHALAAKTTKEDVFAALKFLLVAVVVLPLLPDEKTGPYDALNPRKLGLLVALLAGVGFGGYVAMRAFGARHGLVLTGLLGGLVSSTAVTLAAARHAKSAKAAPLAATSAAVAWAVMGARVLVVAAAFDAELLRALAVPVAAVGVVGAAAAAVLWARSRGHGDGVELAVKNPVELSAALQMTLVVAAVLVATKFAEQRFGAGGVYATSALAGTVDVDAVTVSMAGLARGRESVAAPATAVLVAIASNTVAKTTIAAVVGGARFARTLLVPAAAMVLAAAAGVVWLWI
jgi:uncharacterized membrane protein (DUF4010 family)